MVHCRDEKAADAPMADAPPLSNSRHATRSRIAIVAFIVLCIAICGLFFSLSSPFSPSTPGSISFSRDIDWPDEQEERFNPMKRYSLEYGRVACWQNGGLWMKHLTPLEMASIGVDRFHDTERSLDHAEEDAFCARLRAYGASFWSLPPRWPSGEPDYISWCDSIDCVEPDIDNGHLTLGFPESGGVWLLDASQGWDQFYPGLEGLRGVITIEERCNVIRDVGGKFCETMLACPETAALVGDVEILKKDLDEV